MSRRVSLAIAWACSFLLVAVPVGALFYAVNLESFALLARENIGLPIQWRTVSEGQWYAAWLLTAAYLSIGLVGLYFLRRAFKNFAAGELFNNVNSRDLRRFSVFLIAQAIATPVHLSLLSVLLSLNHPAGQKLLAISFGSNELKAIAVALILWVLSDLLVEGAKLHAENKQFV
ncbi:MAG: DUF2975 domain-containing protein [Pseudomonadota bacterium]